MTGYVITVLTVGYTVKISNNSLKKKNNVITKKLMKN